MRRSWFQRVPSLSTKIVGDDVRGSLKQLPRIARELSWCLKGRKQSLSAVRSVCHVIQVHVRLPTSFAGAVAGDRPLCILENGFKVNKKKKKKKEKEKWKMDWGWLLSRTGLSNVSGLVSLSMATRLLSWRWLRHPRNPLSLTLPHASHPSSYFFSSLEFSRVAGHTHPTCDTSSTSLPFR